MIVSAILILLTCMETSFLHDWHNDRIRSICQINIYAYRSKYWKMGILFGFKNALSDPCFNEASNTDIFRNYASLD